MPLEFKTQNRVCRIILRVKCQKVSADETPSRVFDTSLIFNRNLEELYS